MLQATGQPAFADPFTQVYQTVVGALKSYAPLFQPAGGGAFATIQDMTDPNFQIAIEQYGTGDTPTLLCWQRRLQINPFGANSTIADFTVDVVLATTTDTMGVIPMNQIVYLIFLALVQQPLNLGLPFVREWTVNGGDAVVVNPQDAAAGGSKRWSYATTVTVKGFQSARSLQGFQPFVVAPL